ncbi:MAG: hypothetical protein KGH88_03555 [Thaumarchaeota archaeon]|nr:hypothetical protein [Nitrososphaerota archaeon]
MQSGKLIWSLILASIFLVLQPLTQLVYAEYKELNLQITVSQDQARVVEQINPRTIVSTITIQAISSDISHVLATDQDNVVLATSQSGNMIRIDTLGAAHVTLTYNANIVTKNSGVSTISYNSSNIESTVVLPLVSDIVSVNNVPNDISNNKITMPAGIVSISYVTRMVTENTLTATWNGTNYEVNVITASKLEKFGFDHKSRNIAFTVDEQAPALVILPKTLLGGQYTVTLNGNTTTFKDYYQNATHSWIRIDPSSSGTIKITGTTVAVPEFLSVQMLVFAMSMIISLFVVAQRFSWLK